MVSSQALYEVAQEIDLGDAIALGVGEESAHGRQKESILADSFEGLLGAVFFDGGIETAKLVIERLFSRLVVFETFWVFRDFSIFICGFSGS